MTEYRVIWAIDVDADTPEDAAARALEIQRDPDSLATVFSVSARDRSPADPPTIIDLLPLEGGHVH